MVFEHVFLWECTTANAVESVMKIKGELIPTLAIFVTETAQLLFRGDGRIVLRTKWKNDDACKSILSSVSVTSVLQALEAKGVRLVDTQLAQVVVR
jgi:hypothetical protein